MPKFRKRPVIIEAFQLTAVTRADNSTWPEWLNRAWQMQLEKPGCVAPWYAGAGDGPLVIFTLEGPHRAEYGDWIIQGVKGELYPCKPDIFALTYEAAD